MVVQLARAASSGCSGSSGGREAGVSNSRGKASCSFAADNDSQVTHVAGGLMSDNLHATTSNVPSHTHIL